jgi:hypothetical protein
VLSVLAGIQPISQCQEPPGSARIERARSSGPAQQVRHAQRHDIGDSQRAAVGRSDQQLCSRAGVSDGAVAHAKTSAERPPRLTGLEQREPTHRGRQRSIGRGEVG